MSADKCMVRNERRCHCERPSNAGNHTEEVCRGGGKGLLFGCFSPLCACRQHNHNLSAYCSHLV